MMKKSTFLQSSKNMLSKSFSSSKCKMSLRLASSRLKLLRNKKEVQVNQMKREIAQLLETGQNQSARIRVEHVIREEKMMSAFDLIEIYCELIVARLPIIESQKHCPIDLKEAITSLIFASPRIGDVPELVDVKKHLTAKYGKDFATAALDLRPDCGVSRMLVEKLSAMAPDGQTKIKILTAIANEHSVKWDPTFFEEKESLPPNDLLEGPSTFVTESKVQVETPNMQAPYIHAPQINTEAHGSPSKFSQQYHRTSMETKATSHSQDGNNAESSQGNSPSYSLNKQKWSMDFKDATSAAQAAAESAEMASMAARAAAELSIHEKITKQNSIESHKLDPYVSGNETSESYATRNSRREQFSEPESVSSSVNPMLVNLQTHGIGHNNVQRSEEEGHGGMRRYNLSSSPKEDSRNRMSMKSESHKSREKRGNDSTSIVENVRGKQAVRQPSSRSTRSDSNISNVVNIFSPPDNRNHVNNDDTPRSTRSHESGAAVFDKYDSDGEVHGFDMGPIYDELESDSHLPSPSTRSNKNLSINRHPSSNRSGSSSNSPSPFSNNRQKTSSDLSEKLASIDNSDARVVYDNSDGPSSDSDRDMIMSRAHRGKTDTSDLLSSNKSGKQSGFSFEEFPTNDFGDSSPEGNKEGLNFGKLTGGFRQRGNKQSLHFKKGSDVSSSSNKKASGEPSRFTKTSAVESSRIVKHDELDSDTSEEEEEEEPVQKISSHNQKLHKSGDKMGITSVRTGFLSKEDSDFDEDSPKETTPTKKAHLRSGVSMRTKANANSGSYASPRLRSDTRDDRNPATSYASESPKRSEDRMQQTKPASRSNYWGPPEPFNSAKQTSKTSQDGGMRQNASEVQETANIINNDSYLNKDNKDTKKASHVHPKLPDYETLVQALRRNRS